VSKREHGFRTIPELGGKSNRTLYSLLVRAARVAKGAMILAANLKP
jgi:hypothetical protein